jgi:hypothetical protein
MFFQIIARESRLFRYLWLNNMAGKGRAVHYYSDKNL